MSLKALSFPARLWRSAALLALALVFAGAMATKPGAAADRLVAIGDLHGDYDAYLDLLKQAGLVDTRGAWAGGKTVFVQMGDAVDRGPRSRDIVQHLMRLQRAASRAGGKVITLVGNHEAMNVIGDLRYVPAAEYQNYATPRSEALREEVYRANKLQIEAAYRQANPDMTEAEVKAKWLADTPLGFIEHRRAWSPKGEFGRWVASNPAIVKIGNNLFVHGGISAKYAAYPIDKLNAMVSGALETKEADDDAVLEDELGPLWYRGLASETDAAMADVAAIIAAYRVKRIVIGHTPNLTGIKVLQGGRVIAIDTGITAVYGGTRSFLSIEGPAILAHDNGKTTELKAAESLP
ncbi:MAG: metallophosphoesterase [Alphaproteobacteria bacterium]